MAKPKPSTRPQPAAMRLHKAIAHPPSASGIKRLILDIPASDHARFKAICALHSTTMTCEINSWLAAQFATPGAPLSQALYLRVSPQLKRELVEYARARRFSLTDLVVEAFALLQRQRESVPFSRAG